jgi:hypothetical protein
MTIFMVTLRSAYGAIDVTLWITKNVQLITHRTQRQIADSLTERSNCSD